jgi:hypothetical protein
LLLLDRLLGWVSMRAVDSFGTGRDCRGITGVACWYLVTDHARITGMAAPKGRQMRKRAGERALYADVAVDIIERLDAGAAVMNVTRAAYIERLIRALPVDDRGLPLVLADQAAEYLPQEAGEEPIAA